MEKEGEFGTEDPKVTYKLLFVIGIVAVIGSLSLIAGEILDAKNNCNSLDGSYSLKIYPPQHFCNNQNFSKYSTGGWNFDSNRNYEINFNKELEG